MFHIPSQCFRSQVRLAGILLQQTLAFQVTADTGHDGMREPCEALEICVEQGVAGNIELTFNTNMTKIPKSDRELWAQFKSVNLLCSMKN